MIEADSVHSTPRTDSSSILQFKTIEEAEDFLKSQSFRLVDGTCNWTNDDGDDAGVYSMDGYWGEVKAWRVEINRRAAETNGYSPKPDGTDEVGMAWWNRITKQERAKWLERAGSARPIDAWEAYRRSAGVSVMAKAEPKHLRVGSLELDLVNRAGKRGDRSFDLRPLEARLLKYMMQRSGQLLTHAQLLQDVWDYKFVPETTNVVAVHMGKLRRKVDGPGEAPMIRNVRGAGFILDAT